ncbi:MAG TPA: NAD-glutamate dehydrogenase [Solirubrobacteraceae bacterium]|nr:NAD-glutamate dehydrogenase [Solirubrobacteraceae bacterium]
MAVKAGDRELDLIDSVITTVTERIGQEPSIACQEFVRQLFHWVPAQDLNERDTDELAGMALAQYHLAAHRAPGEAKVNIYNPDPERDGWSSSHTAVEIVCDDMPFLVDSVTMELNRQEAAIELLVHPVMRFVREDDELVDVLAPDRTAYGAQAESVIHVDIARQADPERLAVLRAGIDVVLEEVRAAVEDWGKMRAQTTVLATELRRQAPPCDHHQLDECEAFLGWLSDDNFTYLGYREYELQESGALVPIEGTGLGILRGTSSREPHLLSGRALDEARSPDPLVLTKANSKARVHRPSYLDYVGVKRFAPDGRVVGERRFLGLYTSAAYHASPRTIPRLRDKVEYVLELGGFPPDSHDAKGLIDILESLPRDLLVEISQDDLFDLAIGILGLGERPRVRLFVSPDRLDRFVACTLCMPRDRFNTTNRIRAGEILVRAFGGSQFDWRLNLSESVNVRINYIVRCPDGIRQREPVSVIEARITEVTRSWTDELQVALISKLGEADGVELYHRYGEAFSAGYRADSEAPMAIADIVRIDELRRTGKPVVAVYRRGGEAPEMVRCRLLSAAPVSLSDVVPKFEHMGATVVDERPYEIAPLDEESVWVYDFGLRCDPDGLQRAGAEFPATFLGVWLGELEDDRLNALVMRAELTGREVTIIRAVLRYLRQTAIAFSDAYMITTILANPTIVAQLAELFQARFNPDRPRGAEAERLEQEITEAIDGVASLDADRILRSLLAVVQAMLRTNYYRRDDDGRPPTYVSFKLDPTRLEMLPMPRPRFEIFVYSPRVEGIHLRGGRVARGGLRWSDRREDFRTEVLGLMKAQMVKNALIVPVGSKGGFIVKRPPPADDREATQREAIACYRTFLRGLLDLTDNYAGDEVIAPARVVRYDDDDPYLVVAADKGTAAFSDIANAVAAEYDFWLGDAFASGGSHGYDHKQMGITARGAWESVKRHFRELGTDIQSEDFTVVGVGDMSGDVFGNGMLCSPHIRLLAAFNHAHIFLDPDPDPKTSFDERRRLYELPRSAWSDYDPSLISAGGGVHRRDAKSIEITPEVRSALAIEAERLSPAELIAELLKAPVDLLFNGGIGTYVKASSETNAQVGDRANDGLRVNGEELRCRVVGEGGNLGLTQSGRVEYALRGGPDQSGGQICNDAVDNVAGVNCSDHEVNIKIMLDGVVASGQLTFDERNEMLASMTDAVADTVLYGSYMQTQAISISLAQAVSMREVHARMIGHLEEVAGLDRELEGLPSKETLAQRRSERRGLLSPELAVLIAYCKIHLYALLVESDLPDEPYLVPDLERYFPHPLDRYSEQMRGHRLRRELIATVVANQLVDRAGTTFAFRLNEETGVAVPQLARAFAVAREVFEMREFWREVEALDNRIEASTQLSMLIEGRKLVERSTRWLVRSRPRGEIDVAQTAARFAGPARTLAAALPDALEGHDRETFDARVGELLGAGVEPALATRVASMNALLSVFDIVEDADRCSCEQELATTVYFGIGSRLGLDWLRDRIFELPRSDRWQALARAALRDDLYELHRALTRDVLAENALPDADGEALIERWLERNAAPVQRTENVLSDVRASENYNTTTLPVLLRELKNLV